jgi:hypothetical protein
VPAGKLVDWMIKFQFDGDVDYFELDPVTYAAALGAKGMAAYRARLEEVRATLGPQPVDRLVTDPARTLGPGMERQAAGGARPRHRRDHQDPRT